MTAQTPQPDEEPTFVDVLKRLDTLTARVEKLSSELDTLKKNSEQAEKWEARTWDIVKWAVGLAAALSISAAVSLLGIVIRGAFNAT